MNNIHTGRLYVIMNRHAIAKSKGKCSMCPADGIYMWDFKLYCSEHKDSIAGYLAGKMDGLTQRINDGKRKRQKTAGELARMRGGSLYDKQYKFRQ